MALKVREYGLAPLVVDPVMVAKSGDALLEPAAPGQPWWGSSSRLPRWSPPTSRKPRLCAVFPSPAWRRCGKPPGPCRSLGPKSVVVKGGHLIGNDSSTDLFFDGENFEELTEHTDRHQEHARDRMPRSLPPLRRGLPAGTPRGRLFGPQSAT